MKIQVLQPGKLWFSNQVKINQFGSFVRVYKSISPLHRPFWNQNLQWKNSGKLWYKTIYILVRHFDLTRKPLAFHTFLTHLRFHLVLGSFNAGKNLLNHNVGLTREVRSNREKTENVLCVAATANEWSESVPSLTVFSRNSSAVWGFSTIFCGRLKYVSGMSFMFYKQRVWLDRYAGVGGAWRGGGPDFGRSVSSFPTRGEEGQIMPTTLLPAPPDFWTLRHLD